MTTIRYRLILPLSFLLWLGACTAPTSIESTWLDTEFKRQPYKNLAVVAMFNSKAESRKFEERIVAALARQGVAAEEGYKLLADSKEYSRTELEQVLQRVGADGILMFKLIAVDEGLVYRPPVNYEIRDPYFGIWPYYRYYYPHPYYYDYFRAAYIVTRSPGYWREVEYYVIETTLYDNASENLVWTIKSETRNPDDIDELAESVIRKVSGKLAELNLIEVSGN